MADETETPTTDALAPDPTKTVTTANTQSTSEVTKPDPLLIASLTAQNDQAKAAAQAAEEAGAAKAAEDCAKRREHAASRLALTARVVEVVVKLLTLGFRDVCRV